MSEQGPLDQQKRAGAMYLVASLGSAIAGPIIVAIVAGLWLDRRFAGGGFFLMGMIALGTAASVVAGYRLVKPYL